MSCLKKIILLIFLLNVKPLYPQNAAAGLYKSVDDFLKMQITFPGKNTHIHLHEFFKTKSITVKQNDSVFYFLKKDLYGYIDKEGNAYRFFNNEIYPILNPAEKIILYKRVSGTGLKNSPFIETYFFSKDAGSEIMALTLASVEKVFADNPSFQQLIGICFHYNSDLTEFDSIHNQYRINRLLELSEHNNITK